MIEDINTLSNYCQSKNNTDRLYEIYQEITSNANNLYALYGEELNLLKTINTYIENCLIALQTNDDMGNNASDDYSAFQSNSKYQSKASIGSKLSNEAYERYRFYLYDPSLIKSGEKMNNLAAALTETGATIFVISTAGVTEGVGLMAEQLLDGMVLGKTINMIPVSALYGIITGEGAREGIKDSFEASRGFIEKKWVKSLFENFYDTKVGNTLKEYTVNFDSSRDLSNAVGKAAPSVALAIITSGESLAVQMLATGAYAGTTGMGSAAEKAYNDGADTYDGAKYAVVVGARKGITGALKKASPDMGVHVGPYAQHGMDIAGSSIESGFDAFIEPAEKIIYKKTYTDVNGNEVPFTDDDDLYERYALEFVSEGGIDNVVGKMVEGAAEEATGKVTGGIDNKITKKIVTKVAEKSVDQAIDDFREGGE